MSLNSLGSHIQVWRLSLWYTYCAYIYCYCCLRSYRLFCHRKIQLSLYGPDFHYHSNQIRWNPLNAGYSFREPIDVASYKNSSIPLRLHLSGKFQTEYTHTQLQYMTRNKHTSVHDRWSRTIAITFHHQHCQLLWQQLLLLPVLLGFPQDQEWSINDYCTVRTQSYWSRYGFI